MLSAMIIKMIASGMKDFEMFNGNVLMSSVSSVFKYEKDLYTVSNSSNRIVIEIELDNPSEFGEVLLQKKKEELIEVTKFVENIGYKISLGKSIGRKIKIVYWLK